MKYKAKFYAKILVDLMQEDKNLTEKSRKVKLFLDFISSSGDRKQGKEIILLAEKLYAEKTGKRKIILETARKTDISAISKKIKKDGDFLTQKINPDITAGVKITVNDQKQLDFSLKNKLDKIFEQ